MSPSVRNCLQLSKGIDAGAGVISCMAYSEQFKQPLPQPWDDEAQFDVQRETDLLMSAGESKNIAIAIANLLSPYLETEVDIDGQKYLILAQQLGDGDGGGGVFWGIEVTDAKRGAFRLKRNGASILPPGKFRDIDAYEIIDSTKVFRALEGNTLMLETEALSEGGIKITLVYKKMEKVYETETDAEHGDTKRMKKYFYPLYYTVDADDDTAGIYVGINKDNKLKRLVPDTALMARSSLVRTERDTIPFLALEFISSFASIEQ